MKVQGVQRLLIYQGAYESLKFVQDLPPPGHPAVYIPARKGTAKAQRINDAGIIPRYDGDNTEEIREIQRIQRNLTSP